MDIRTLAGNAKPQEEKESEIQQTVRQFHERFMKETGYKTQIVRFYNQEVKPLFEQKKPYESLQQIESEFAAMIISFQKVKGIDVDILKGYSHFLTFYKLLACFQFLQPNQGSRKEVLSPHEVKSPMPKEIPLSDEAKAKEMLSPLEAKSPVSQEIPLSDEAKAKEMLSPREIKSPGSEEIQLSEGFIALQSSSAERNFVAYQEELKKWEKKPFPFNEIQVWRSRVSSLNQDIISFNQHLGTLSFPSVEEKKVRPNDAIESLLLDEKDFASFDKNLQELTLEHKRLIGKHSQFEEDKNSAILSLEQMDDQYCNQLTTTRFRFKFSSEELAKFKETAEFKRIMSFYSSRKSRCASKELELKGLKESIQKLQSELGSLLIEKENVLGRLLVRNRILALLGKFKLILEEMFNQRMKTLKENNEKVKKLSDEADAKLEKRIKALKKFCKTGVQEKLELMIKSFKESAISTRKEKRTASISELKSHLAVISFNDVLPLHEVHKKKEEQLDLKWESEIKKITDDYYTQLLAITSGMTPSDEREKIHEKIQVLKNFYITVERRRVVIVTSDVNENIRAARRNRITHFIDGPFARLMEEIESMRKTLQAKWITKQIDFYSMRYGCIKLLTIFDEKKSKLQVLLKEIQDFQLAHQDLDENETKLLRKLIRRIELKLSYDNQRRDVSKRKALEYQSQVARKIISNPGESAEIVRQAGAGIVALKLEEDANVRRDLKSQAQENKGQAQDSHVLEERVKQINKPLHKLAEELENYAVPEYSCGWALFWTVLTLPLFCVGYCFYQWWYHRQCRLAAQNLERKQAQDVDSRDTSNAVSAVPSAELRTRRLSPEAGNRQDRKFMEFPLREGEEEIEGEEGSPKQEKKELSSSSSRMTHTMSISSRDSGLEVVSDKSKGQINWLLRIKVSGDENNRKSDIIPLTRSTTASPYKGDPQPVTETTFSVQQPGVYPLTRSKTDSLTNRNRRTAEYLQELVSPGSDNPGSEGRTVRFRS